MEQLSEFVSAKTNTPNNRRAVFSVRSVRKGYEKDKDDRLRQSSSGAPSEQLVESWEDGFESSGVECWLAGSGVTTEAENLHCGKSVARKRLMETVIDWGY
jgi:hypothetical protein